MRWRPKIFKRHALDDELACTQTNMKIIGSILPSHFYICNEDEGLIKSWEPTFLSLFEEFMFPELCCFVIEYQYLEGRTDKKYLQKYKNFS